MGWGDELMAAGQARRAQEADPRRRRVQILDQYGRARTNPIWDGNPRIAPARVPGEARGDYLRVRNGPNCRPYHLEKRPDRWIFNPGFRPDAGEIYFSDEERAFASSVSPQIVIEPTLKDRAPVNKQWPAAYWTRFVALAGVEGLELVQLGPAGTRPLPGVSWILTPDFRRACAVLARARAYVGHEGGLHHAAAALGVRGVVIFGGFIPVEVTGYPIHRNLGVSFADACGTRVARCAHCEREMARITPEEVLAALLEQLAEVPA